MDSNYTFQMFYEDLANGFQFYYVYMGCKYLIYKMNKNCYRNELVDAPPKCPHQKTAIYTLKRVQEIFPFMENLEYISVL